MAALVVSTFVPRYPPQIMNNIDKKPPSVPLSCKIRLSYTINSLLMSGRLTM